jgi:GNAT superfamily N-acetyltransferase
MITILRTNSDDPDLITLVKQLDAELEIRNREFHSFYSRFNKLDKIRHVVLAYDDDKLAGCGAIKEFGPDTMEIKRMYVRPGSRRKGIAFRVLNELEKWAGELSYRKTILETSLRQPEAIGLYKKNGYTLIPNFGQYTGFENSICFEKQLKAQPFTQASPLMTPDA